MKSPIFLAGEDLKPHSREWYAHPWAWEDGAAKTYKYQMSGAPLAPYRNQIMAGLMDPEAVRRLQENGIEILLSGGITDNGTCRCFAAASDGRNGIDHPPVSAFQVGTLGLLHTDISKENGWGLEK